MRRVARVFVVFVLLLTACEGAPAETRRVEAAFLVHRLHVHPATGLSDWLATDGEDVSVVLEDFFEFLACYGGGYLVPRVIADIGVGGGTGSLELLIGTQASDGEPCQGDIDVLVQSSSYVDPNATPRVAQVSGPLFIEGRTFEARVNLGDFEIADTSLVLFPRWWQVTGELQGFDPATGEIFEGGLRLNDAEARAVWTVYQLGETTVEGAAVPALVQLAMGDTQPDVDMDGDGLERLMAVGGEIVACVDGDGTVIEGATCHRDPRIADGYDTRLVFRLLPIAELQI